MRRSLVQHALAAAIIATLWLRLLGQSAERDVTTDEPAWITSGYVTLQLVRELASPSRWETAYEARQLGDWGNHNPPVAKLLIGLATAHALRPGDRVDYRWLWDRGASWNLREGAMPPAHVLFAARAAIAGTAALCLLLAYLIALECTGGGWFALWAPFALGLIPIFSEHAALVYTDVPQLMFLLLAAWALMRFFARRRWAWLLVSLLAAGLACAVKFSSGPAVLAIVATLLWTEKGRQRGYVVAATLTVPFAVFVAVNPYLYPAPVRRTAALITGWSESKREQQSDAQLANTSVQSRKRAASLVFQRVALSQEHRRGPIEFVGGALLTLGLLVRTSVAWRQRKARSVLPWLLVSAASAMTYAVYWDAWGGGPLALLCAGLCVGLRCGHHAAQPSSSNLRRRSLALVFLVFAVCVAAWLPFAWSRYYLPVLVWVPALQAVGLAALWCAGGRESGDLVSRYRIGEQRDAPLQPP
jgi:4-amino-4-deoxy-L-arabinose transferase-like glycosyltransferase